MIKALKALSALLTYPSAELQQAAGEISEAIENEPAISVAVRDQLHRLLKELAGDDLYDLQERYVLLFDHTRSLSLHLFEHVHGESRDRGQAMIDLKAQYEKAGLVPDAAELPDFLPLFLEFLSTLPARRRATCWRSRRTSLPPWRSGCASAARLTRASSARWSRSAAAKPKETEVSALLALPDPDATDMAARDAAWADEAVSFGPGASDGCKDGLIARVRGALRPAPDMPASASTIPPRQ